MLNEKNRKKLFEENEIDFESLIHDEDDPHKKSMLIGLYHQKESNVNIDVYWDTEIKRSKIQ